MAHVDFVGSVEPFRTDLTHCIQVLHARMNFLGGVWDTASCIYSHVEESLSWRLHVASLLQKIEASFGSVLSAGSDECTADFVSTIIVQNS